MVPELRKLIDWAKKFEVINGLVLVKALWSGRTSLSFDQHKIIIPTSVAKKAQPFTLAVVLNPGTGYRDLESGDWLGGILDPGEIVIAEQFVAYEEEYEGRTINYLPESRIMAKVKDWSPKDFERLLMD